MSVNTMPDYRPLIRKRLSTFLEGQGVKLSRVGPFGLEASERILEFSQRGKMIRGNILIHFYQTFQDNPQNLDFNDDIIGIAACLELMQSALLIHDDIMDNGLLRRGKPSLLAIYQDLGLDIHSKNHHHFGSSMSLCVGDLVIFLSFLLLTEMKSSYATKIINLCAYELAMVTTAQMSDVFGGHNLVGNKLSKDEILKIYSYKTARYSFSLPLVISAILNNQGKNVEDLMMGLGEKIGILFQIIDDEKDLFGSTETTGKTVLSDLAEGKQTYLFNHLREILTEKYPHHLRRFENIWGNSNIEESDISFIKNLIIEMGVDEHVTDFKKHITEEIRKMIAEIEINSHVRGELYKLIVQINKTSIKS